MHSVKKFPSKKDLKPSVKSEALAQIVSEVFQDCKNVTPSNEGELSTNFLDKIAIILRHAGRQQLLLHEPKPMVKCILRIIFNLKIDFYEKNTYTWKHKNKLNRALCCYHKLLTIYTPEKSKDIAEAIVHFIYKDELWQVETFCKEMLNDTLSHGVDGTILTHIMWDRVESSDLSWDTKISIIKVLYGIFEFYRWPENSDTISVLDRILPFFLDNIINTQENNESGFSEILRKGLKIYLRNIIKNLSNKHLLNVIQHMCSWATSEGMTDDVILYFGNILEYTAFIYKTTLYETSLTPGIFHMIMQMIGSSSEIINLLGNRVLQYIIDRKGNKGIFDTPKIFYENTHVNLKIEPSYEEDKMFFRIYREILHDSLLTSIMNHSESLMNLETTYCTICLIAVEIPCGFSAAAIVCLIMNIQNIVLQNSQKFCRTVGNHIHATIISIMSLICWIHNAKVFYSYVNRITMERARWAPHLNPPIQSQYSFAVHYVQWNKPELYFIDWEVRYGLWKCFRLRNLSASIIG